MKKEEPETNLSSPRTREASSLSLKASARDIRDQLKEDSSGVEESDSSVVVGDGKTDHMAKGWTVIQSKQSTDTRERNAPMKSISSSLLALNRKARGDRKHRFRSLYSLIDKQMLYDCFYRLKKNAATGVDGVTFADYGKNLEGNLVSLLDRLISKRYRAQAVRRTYISKGNGKLRPLGIPALEDKIVQMAAARILESIYEADFSDRSIGYRRNQPGAREASYQLMRELNGGRYRWVVEADIKSFFDEVDHEWVITMLEQRIDDRAFTGLIKKWLKAGILELDATKAWEPESGTPQGGIISPILANIYLHYVLDLWIEQHLRREFSGEMIFMRYADDIIVGFQYRSEARAYLDRLPDRLAKFKLRIAEEKSSLVKFSYRDPEGSSKFTFLGFDFYWARTRRNKNHRVVKRRTNKKKFQQSLQKLKDWIKESRSWPLKMILSSLGKRLRGYWNYYGVIGNGRMTGRYHRAVQRLIYKWLNRRSQRRSYGWTRFAILWHEHWKMPQPRIVEEYRPLYGHDAQGNLAPLLFG